MKIALVYDRVNKIGGAERILSVLHEIWPDAPLYTAVYNPPTAPWADNFKVRPSFLQKFPWAKTKHELYPFLTPLAFESFDFDGYDVVISVTSAEAKGIITKPKTLHICYCLTPTRYLWSHHNLYFKDGFLRWLSAPMVTWLRFWDQIAAQRPDHYLAISENVKERIRKYYGRDSEVIYPPVDTNNFRIRNQASPRDSARGESKIKGGNYFLIVSRLVPYKRIDIAVEAFNQLDLPLKIIGRGSEENKLKAMAQTNIEFLGQLTERGVLQYYQGCQALIFPQDEDLGLTAIEAQCVGKPVIAYRGGGALETVIGLPSTPSADGSGQGKTGEFFYPQTGDALIKAVQNFDNSRYKAEDCRANAARFDKEIFKKKFKTKVEALWHNYQKIIM